MNLRCLNKTTERVIFKVYNKLYLNPKKLNITFLVSTGRTGTVFFENLFNEICQDTLTAHEPNPDVYDLVISKNRHRKSQNEIISEFITRRKVLVRKMFDSNLSKYIEANPKLSFLLDELKLGYPKAKFIIITRDPKTYVNSALNKSPKNDGVNYFYGDYNKDILKSSDFKEDELIDWSKLNRKEKIGWYWNKCNSLLDTFQSNNPKDCLAIKFEDVFLSEMNVRVNTLKSIFAFLGKEANESAIKKSLESISQKQNGTLELKFPGYSDWDDKDRSKFDKIVQPMSKKLNYS